MKKLLVGIAKGCIGLLPQGVKRQLRKNAALTTYYSQLLQRTGIGYGLPSAAKLEKLYIQNKANELAVLNALPQSHVDTFDVVIFGINNIRQSLYSIRVADLPCRKIVVIGTDIKDLPEDIVGADSLAEVSVLLSDSVPALLINSGDSLLPHAFKAFAIKMTDVDLVYSDTECLDASGRVSARYLPDWNPDLQFSCAYVQTGVVLKYPASTLNNLPLSVDTIASLITYLALSDSNPRIGHIPMTLIRQCAERDVTRDLEAIAAQLASQGVESHFSEAIKVNHYQWPLRKQPMVSVVIPTKDCVELVKACIESILEKTTYPNYEILLIDNNSEKAESLAYFAALSKLERIRVLSYPHAFNYSAINNFAVKQALGEVIALVNNDIEVISPAWLTYMVGHVLREDIGCVGAKLLYGHDAIQHAGVVLGYGGGAGHAHKYFPRYHPGYLNRLVASNNYSAVTAACLLVKKSHYIEVGGLNEADLTVAFNDVDFCLKVASLGVRNLYCAEAELYHHESVSRGLDTTPEKAARFQKELGYLQMTWASYIEHDPAYNPNLTKLKENFSIREPSEY